MKINFFLPHVFLRFQRFFYLRLKLRSTKNTKGTKTNGWNFLKIFFVFFVFFVDLKLRLKKNKTFCSIIFFVFFGVDTIQHSTHESHLSYFFIKLNTYDEYEYEYNLHSDIKIVFNSLFFEWFSIIYFKNSAFLNYKKTSYFILDFGLSLL